MLLANVVAFGNRPGAGIAARCTSASTPSCLSSMPLRALDRLAEVGQVDDRGDHVCPRPGDPVEGDHLPAVLVEVVDDRPPELSAAAGNGYRRHAMSSLATMSIHPAPASATNGGLAR